MIKPKFLYNNVIRGITPTWSGTTDADQPPANATDWRDFSLFSADSGNLDYTMATDTDIDTLSVYVATFTGTGAETIVLQYESSPSTYTTLATINPAGGKLTFNEFTGVTVSSGRNIRFVITAGTGTLLIRQLVVGEAMEAEQGQDITSITYPTLLGGVKIANTISANGSIIGRSLKRLEKQGVIDLDLLTEAWVRSTWEPFAAHTSRYPFIYAPNTRDYATEVGFCATQGGTEAPTYMGKRDRMSVKIKINILAADEHGL